LVEDISRSAVYQNAVWNRPWQSGISSANCTIAAGVEAPPVCPSDVGVPSVCLSGKGAASVCPSGVDVPSVCLSGKGAASACLSDCLSGAEPLSGAAAAVADGGGNASKGRTVAGQHPARNGAPADGQTAGLRGDRTPSKGQTSRRWRAGGRGASGDGQTPKPVGVRRAPAGDAAADG
jgi:hypothetical protein